MKPPAAAEPQKAPLAARTRFAIGGFSFEAEATATNKGLLAVGGTVSMILLAVAPILLSVAVIKRAKRGGARDRQDILPGAGHEASSALELHERGVERLEEA